MSQDIEHIFQSLRGGSVPEVGLDRYATGVDLVRQEIHRHFDLARKGMGTIKFLRSDYGGGKTFTSRLAVLDGQQQKFATSFVVVSDNDLKFHEFDAVYRRVMEELGTSSCRRAALGDIIDRWIGAIEESLIAAGADESAATFSAQVRDRLASDLQAATGGKAPDEFVRHIQKIYDLKQANNLALAGALISWLSGSTTVGQADRRAIGVTGAITSKLALAYLRGILEIIKAAGYNGLVIVIDEAETILRMRADSRHRSLNGIRQIFDGASGFPGIVWLFTGTPAFFDSKQGVAGLQPLHDRVQFDKDDAHPNLRQPQLAIRPLKAEQLKEIALKLRELYPAKDSASFQRQVTPEFVERLVRDVTTGFKGAIGVIPRHFLRALVGVMDKADQYPATYDPMQHYSFTTNASDLRPEEQEVLTGITADIPDADAGPVPVQEVFF